MSADDSMNSADRPTIFWPSVFDRFDAMRQPESDLAARVRAFDAECAALEDEADDEVTS